MNEEKEMVVIQSDDGTTMEVELVTYLISEDNTKTYLVYSKGEKTGAESDEIVYIARIVRDGDNQRLVAIADDVEWKMVQGLLKKIANA